MKKILLPFVLLLSVFSLSAQYIQIQEDFNDTIMPAGWSTNAVTGNTAWSFGIDGSVNDAGVNNLDGTPMAFFDDDALGLGNLNNTANLLSPVFDNLNFAGTMLEFDYNFRQLNSTLVADSFYVEVFDGTSWISVFSVDTNDCGPWSFCQGNYPHAKIDISSYANANCQIRFTFYDGNEWSFYIGIDNVTISSTISFDMGVDELVTPVARCGLTANEPLTVKLINYGSDTIKNFSVHADINNGSIFLQDTVSSILAPLDSLNYTFDSTANFSNIGFYNIKLYTVLNSDSASLNDTLNITFENKPIFSAPYLDDFENSTDWTTGGVNSSWELGVPNDFVINSAVSGVNAFCTNRLRDYNNDELSYLYSPCFDLSTIQGAPIIQFNLNYITELSYDSLELEFSLDNKLTWSRVESEFSSLNWYSSVDSWIGNSLGWIVVKNTLPSLIGQSHVSFRFRFQSDASAREEGIAIDDFEIKKLDSIDLSIGKIDPDIANYYPCGFGNENIVIQINNVGYSTVDSVNLFYQINGGTIVNELLVDSLLPYSNNSYVFNSFYDFSAAGNYFIKAWLQVAADTSNVNDTLEYYFNQATTVGSNFAMIDNLQDFDSFFAGSCGGGSTSSPKDTLKEGWLESSTGRFTWNVQNGIICGGTSTTTSGPAIDHTGKNGNFLYTEASGNLSGEAILESPCTDFSNRLTAGLRFWYHRYGSDMGNLYIDVYANGIWDEAVDSLVGQSQTSSNDAWKLKEVSFNQFSNQIIKVRFRALYGGGFNGDMAIDDVEFYSRIADDARMESFEMFNTTCEFDTAQLRVVVNNFGTDTIRANQLKIKYQLNNGSTITDSNLSIIPIDSSFTYSLRLNGLYSSNSDKITAWVELPNDSNLFNDTLHINFEPLNRAPVYTEGFENLVLSNAFCGNYNTPLNLAWQTDLNNQWVVGHDSICNYGTSGATPTSLTGPDSAYAGHGFMYFEPAFNSVLDTAILRSTCIDLTNDSISYLEFYYHMYGAGTGKLYIDVSVNGTINRLDSIVGQQQTSMSSPWGLRVINLNQFSGDIIQIRFIAIESSGSNSNEGSISIDNFRVYNSFPVLLDERTLSKNLQLYPNPTNGEFVLVGNDFTNSEIKIHLVDLNGRVIESRIIKSSTNSIKEIFNLSNQPNGVYLISVQSRGEMEVKKIVLSRN